MGHIGAETICSLFNLNKLMWEALGNRETENRENRINCLLTCIVSINISGKSIRDNTIPVNLHLNPAINTNNKTPKTT